ncbi:hypothetical protein [Trujillonella humicola]|uniref:hypothetical protein n=1 Tax=Trujillonella humicola TaxID=3383699 RepID=UPI003906A9A7
MTSSSVTSSLGRHNTHQVMRVSSAAAAVYATAPKADVPDQRISACTHCTDAPSAAKTAISEPATRPDLLTRHTRAGGAAVVTKAMMPTGRPARWEVSSMSVRVQAAEWRGTARWLSGGNVKEYL